MVVMLGEVVTPLDFKKQIILHFDDLFPIQEL